MNKRISQQAAWVLHTIPWRETSVIATVLTPDYGVVDVVAKGAKRPYSVMRPILTMFSPLVLDWSRSPKSTLNTLTAVHFGPIIHLPLKQYMSAWYVNELILRLLAKEDAQAAVFHLYTQTLHELVQTSQASAVLRAFEWDLLQLIGYGFDQERPDFSDQTQANYWRTQCRQRLHELLDHQPLQTRQVLNELLHFK